METQAAESKLVQVRLQSNALESINAVAKRLQTNQTQVVATSVQLADMVTEKLAQGEKLYLERKDGTREQISFVNVRTK